MNKFEQINKMAQAAMLIQEVINSGDCKYTFQLEEINEMLANLADEIEEG